MTSVTAPTAPGATTRVAPEAGCSALSGSQTAASIPVTSAARSSLIRCSRSTTGPALPTMMADHSLGSEAAIRVTSRSPCPDRARAPSPSSSSRAATSEETSWGTWETAATAASCSAAPMRTGVAPTSTARFLMTSSACGSESWPTSTQGRPAKRSQSAAPAPERSRPAIGWEPTYLRASLPARARTSATTRSLTEATSVTTALGWAFSCSTTTSAVTSGGVATTMTCGSGLFSP